MTYLIVGLGNPGKKYAGTRHNTGFDVVDKIASKFGVKFFKPFFKQYNKAVVKLNNDRLILIKPTTYMNLSGAVIPGLLAKHKLTVENLIVVVDNLDIEKGLLKFKLKGSDGGHNGLKSINEYIGVNTYKRLFIGIGRPEKGTSVPEYVLSKITDENVFKAEDRAVEGILMMLNSDISQVMNFLNRRILD